MADEDAAATYLRVMTELAGLSAERAGQQSEVERWHAAQRAGVRRAVADAERAARAAQDRVQAARALVAEVDGEAGHLWQALRVHLGHAARRLGDPPAPSTTPPADADPHELLAHARELLARARHPRALPGWAYPVLVGFGVLGAGLTAAAAYGLRRAAGAVGGDLAVGLPVLALIVALLGPVVGLAPAKLLTERRGATLDAGAVAVVILVGLATAGALAVLTR